MISIKLNHQNVKAKHGQTILDVAKANSIKIPTLCHFPRGKAKDNPRAVCRICVVEIAGVKGLVTACSAKVTENMEVFTHSASVIEARKVLMEFILAENQGGKEDTMVKQLSEELGVECARFSLPDKANESQQLDSQQLDLQHSDSHQLESEYFNIDPSLCIHCDRCIVACESRKVISRTGFGYNVSTAFGGDDSGIEASDCNYCGDCVSACPAGGITKA